MLDVQFSRRVDKPPIILSSKAMLHINIDTQGFQNRVIYVKSNPTFLNGGGKARFHIRTVPPEFRITDACPGGVEWSWNEKELFITAETRDKLYMASFRLEQTEHTDLIVIAAIDPRGLSTLGRGGTFFHLNIYRDNNKSDTEEQRPGSLRERLDRYLSIEHWYFGICERRARLNSHRELKVTLVEEKNIEIQIYCVDISIEISEDETASKSAHDSKFLWWFRNQNWGKHNKQ